MRGDNHLLAVTTVADEATGQIKPLFSFPIQIAKATAEQDVKLDIAGPSGAPRKQIYVDTGTGEQIENGDSLHGVRLGDEFKPIPDEALAEIDKATKIETMVVLGKVPLADVDFTRATGTYFVQSPSKGGSPKSYRLLYETLRERGKGQKKRPATALVTKRTARTKQKLGVIYAREDLKCLMWVELRFAADLRQPDEQILAPQTATVEDAQIEKAGMVIDGLADGTHALDTEVDEAVALKRELVEKAVEGEEIHAPIPVADTAATDDLEAALEASLAGVAS